MRELATISWVFRRNLRHGVPLVCGGDSRASNSYACTAGLRASGGLLRGDIQNGLAVELTASQGFYNLAHVTPAAVPHDPKVDDTRSHPAREPEGASAYEGQHGMNRQVSDYGGL